MPSMRRVLSIYGIVYTILGLALGIFGYVSAEWARTTYVTAAGGPTVEALGPLFVGLVVFRGVTVALVIGICFAFLMGVILGSKLESTLATLFVGAVGGAFGTSLLGMLAIAIPLIFASPSQTFSVVSVLIPWFTAVVLSSVTGLVGGYVVSG